MKKFTIVFIGLMLLNTLAYSAKPKRELNRVIVPESHRVITPKALQFWNCAQAASREGGSLEGFSKYIAKMGTLIQRYPRILETSCRIGLGSSANERIWSPLEFAAYCTGRSYWVNQSKSERWMIFLNKVLQFDTGYTNRIMALNEGVRCLSVEVVGAFLKAETDISGASLLPCTLIGQCEHLTKHGARKERSDDLYRVAKLLVNANVDLSEVSLVRTKHAKLCRACNLFYRIAKRKQTQQDEYRP